jgi:hypothetical protein
MGYDVQTLSGNTICVQLGMPCLPRGSLGVPRARGRVPERDQHPDGTWRRDVMRGGPLDPWTRASKLTGSIRDPRSTKIGGRRNDDGMQKTSQVLPLFERRNCPRDRGILTAPAQ